MFPFLKAVQRGSDVKPHPPQFEPFFFPKSAEEFITAVRNTETCHFAYTLNESDKYFQSFLLTRVQHQNFRSWQKLEWEGSKWLNR